MLYENGILYFRRIGGKSQNPMATNPIHRACLSAYENNIFMCFIRNRGNVNHVSMKLHVRLQSVRIDYVLVY